MVDQHLSIGEVLSLLQSEFPDVTISKIRFLESQGLIDPERTPSGYRKFYNPDIERLRWILTQQRENFLPLKVIKDRLDELPTGEDQGGGQGSVGGPLSFAPDTSVESSAGDERPASESSTVRASMPAGELPPTVASEPIWMADLARGRTEVTVPDPPRPRPTVSLDDGPADLTLSAEELQAAAGISGEVLRSLVQYGLIVGRELGDDTYFDADSLVIARKAASSACGSSVEAAMKTPSIATIAPSSSSRPPSNSPSPSSPRAACSGPTCSRARASRNST